MAAPDPVLVGVRGSSLSAGSKLELASKHREYVIGRGNGSDVIVNSSSESGTRVSRRHVAVNFLTSSWIVSKVGGWSGAKLLVNDVIVDNYHTLTDGDEIKLEGLPFCVVFKSKNSRSSVRVNPTDKNQQELKEMKNAMKKTKKELKEAQKTLSAVLNDLDNQNSNNNEVIKILRDENQELRSELKRKGSSSESPDFSKRSKSNGLTEELTCSVCSELIVNAISLECGHLFCSYCINQWQVAKPDVTCPNCRKAVTTLHSIPTIDNIVDLVVAGLDDTAKAERERFVRDRKDQAKGAGRRDLRVELPAIDHDVTGDEVEGQEDYRSMDERQDDDESQSEEALSGSESEEEEEGGGVSQRNRSTDLEEEEEEEVSSNGDSQTSFSSVYPWSDDDDHSDHSGFFRNYEH